MKSLMYLLLTLFFVNFPLWLQAQPIISRDMDKIAEKYANKHRNRGLVVGIISGKDLQVKGYGHLSTTQDFIPDEHTIFEIGSLTGVFTTTLLMLETQKGTIRLDEPIHGFLPSDIYMPAYQPFVCHIDDHQTMTASGHDRVRMICEPDPMQLPVSVSFCDLASHTSGLPNTPKGLYSWNPLKWAGKHSKDPYHDFSREQLYDNLYKYVLALPPGSFYQYSDAGLALLGNILADYNQMSYDELLQVNVLDRLQMYDTDTKIAPRDAIRFAIGHTRKGKVTEHWHHEGMAPAIGLRSTAGDLLRFLQANLQIEEDALSQAFAQVQQPRIDVPKHRNGKETMGAYGWFVSILSEDSNLPVTWINGGTGGFRSFMALNHDRNIAIVILSNSANPVDKIGFELIEHLVNKSDHKLVYYNAL